MQAVGVPNSYAYVGGFAGVMKDTQLKKIEIDNVIFDGFEIEAKNVTDICGGLISSICNNAELYFKDANDTGNASLYVKDATINAENTKSLGGLAYRIGGMCEIKSNGVNLEKLIKDITEKTKNNKKGIFNVCINYGGYDEIIDMTKKIYFQR